MSLSSLSRAELQALAKQHGIRANMKNAEIEAALMEKGVTQPKKAGLSVRDPNVQTDSQKPPANGKAVSKATSSKESVSSENDENLIKNTTTKRVPRSTSIASNSTENTASTNTSSELPPIARRSSRLSRSSTNDERNSFAQESSQETTLIAPSEESESTRRRSTRRSSISSQSDAASSNSSSQVESAPSTEEAKEVEQVTAGDATMTENVEVEPTEEAKPRREKPARYASRRKSAEREVVLAEIKKENVIAPESKMAVEQVQEEEQKETAVIEKEAVVAVETQRTAETQPTEAETSVIQEAIVVKQVTTPSVATISGTSASNVSGKRSGRQIRMPEMLRTPQGQQPVVEEHKPDAPENAQPAGAETKENIQPEAVTAAPPAPVEATTKGFVVPEMKRMAPLPLILPPTPPVVKQKREERLAMEKNDVDRLLGHYKGALEALSFVPDLLRRQKELLNELEVSKQENKRLREYIGMSE